MLISVMSEWMHRSRRMQGSMFLLVFALMIGMTSLLHAQSNTEIQGTFSSTTPLERFTGEFFMRVQEVPVGFNLTMSSRISEQQSTLSEEGYFRDMEIRLLEQSGGSMIKYFGHDRREISYDPDEGELRIEYSLYGESDEVKTLGVKEDFILFDTAFLALQKRLHDGHGTFVTDLVFSEDGKRRNAEFELHKTASLLTLSPQFDSPPAFFRDASVLDYEANVYAIGLTGLAGFFFRHTFYFAFDPTQGNEFVAYWGGDPEYPNFWIADKEEQ